MQTAMKSASGGHAIGRSAQGTGQLPHTEPPGLAGLLPRLGDAVPCAFPD